MSWFLAPICLLGWIPLCSEQPAQLHMVVVDPTQCAWTIASAVRGWWLWVLRCAAVLDAGQG